MTGPTPAAPVAWPDGRRAAAAFTFDVDAESAALITDPGSARRPGVMSHQAYGPLVGVPRLLRVLDRHGITATFFVPGYTAHRYPGVVADIAAAGHEIAHHGYLHEPLSGVDEATEARYLDRGLAALEEVVGVRPVGYRAPMWEPTLATPRLLAERGFLYDSSLMDADVPYELAVAGVPDQPSIVEIPIHWALDDWEQYCFVPGLWESLPIASPDKTLGMWRLELRAMTAEAGCFVLTCHPFLSGRPGRAAALDALIGEAVATEGLWVTSLRQIAEHVRSLGLAPRTLPVPPPLTI